MKQKLMWLVFIISTLIGAGLSHIMLGVDIEWKFLFGFSLGIAFMQGWNYEDNRKSAQQEK